MADYKKIESEDLEKVSGGTGDIKVIMQCTWEDCKLTFDPEGVQTTQTTTQTENGANLDIMFICPHCNRETKGKVVGTMEKVGLSPLTL